MQIEQKIQKQVSLAPLTTFKIGGPAEYYLETGGKEELEAALGWAKENELEITFLGGGSNVLINDEGIEGLVITLSNKDFEIKENKIICGAAASLSKTAQGAAKHGLSGLEWGAGIPRAQIGGSVAGNAGAFGTNTSEVVEVVEAFNLKKGKWEKFSREDCEFGYRTSIFKKSKNYLIFSATLKLEEKDAEEVKKKTEEILKARQEVQPKKPNAGSMFKNLEFSYLKERNPDMAERAEMEGVVKNNMIGSGWLVEQRDLKGKEIGGAQVSREHGNFIINKNKATALDVITLISYVKQKVRNEFNVQLQEEIQYLGF